MPPRTSPPTLEGQGWTPTSLYMVRADFSGTAVWVERNTATAGDYRALILDVADLQFEWGGAEFPLVVLRVDPAAGTCEDVTTAVHAEARALQQDRQDRGKLTADRAFSARVAAPVPLAEAAEWWARA